ncbi:hypothetical protein L226DRAFT_13047 [Lentinus tigrinus ALCF2SS1-7]|uniref:uncharacterized protein n=1 Tax=Lentinus tigrinus ALCF2SS1-7 TaxID=1328758 RepID=UPI001166049B|nr:hypothetical protein L226DRAFT_13047 [Lentinus tigrinus ALCF2SS1-7]
MCARSTSLTICHPPPAQFVPAVASVTAPAPPPSTHASITRGVMSFRRRVRAEFRNRTSPSRGHVRRQCRVGRRHITDASFMTLHTYDTRAIRILVYMCQRSSKPTSPCSTDQTASNQSLYTCSGVPHAHPARGDHGYSGVLTLVSSSTACA